MHDLFGEGLSQLLHDPGTGGMFCDVEVQDVATAVADHEATVQYPEGGGGHREKNPWRRWPHDGS